MEPRSTKSPSDEAGARLGRDAEPAGVGLGAGAVGGFGAARLGFGPGGDGAWAGGFGTASLRVGGAGAGAGLVSPPTRARAAEARTLPGSCSITRPYTAAALSKAPDLARESPRPRYASSNGPRSPVR